MRELCDAVIITQTMARQYFPGQDPLVTRVLIMMGDPREHPPGTEIIGIVGDVRSADLVTPSRAMSYWPHPQLAYGSMTFIMRTSGDPLALAPAVQHAVQSIDKDQPIADVRTMDQWLAKSLAQTRFSSMLLAVFAGVTLLPAAICIYSGRAYPGTPRTSATGILPALAAAERV